MCIKDSRTKYFCLQKSQASKDPYVKAWFYQIPKTTKAKAVYQYNRYDKNWTPFNWGSLCLNQKLPESIPEDAFRVIDEQCKPHPIPSYKKWILVYVFVFHIPVITLGGFLLGHLSDDKDGEDKWSTYAILYLATIVILTAIMLVVSISLKCRYIKNLKERKESLDMLLKDLNNSQYLAQGFRLFTGSQGAWIEVQFIEEGIQMVGSAGEPAELSNLSHPDRSNRMKNYEVDPKVSYPN